MTVSPPPKQPHPHHPTRHLNLWQDSALGKEEVRIEIIPLIDVIFCILTFFILGAVGLSRQQAINLDLPKASTSVPQMREMFVVSLDDLGQLYVDKDPVQQAELFNALKNYHQYNPTGLIVLNASRNASYNDVIQLLDLLRQVGGDRVALATIPGAPQENSFAPPAGGASPMPGLPGAPLPNSAVPNPMAPNPNAVPPAPVSPGLSNPLPGSTPVPPPPVPGAPSR
ncbi:MAG: biopolymer transporter ExbD [Cyanobacteria bacterium RI_101]|nr:biopolymer transporter ExbD [Cyanobacteria bacterium RI_101]